MRLTLLVSVDAIKNNTTGISAKDRWNTVKTIINDKSTKSDLARPGHMFPLIAKEVWGFTKGWSH